MLAGVEIRLSVDDEGWDGVSSAEAQARTAAEAALAALRLPARPAEISISLASDPDVQALNRDWRGIDKPTNVLAFPGDDPADLLAGDAPVLLGDVVLARGTVLREAAEQGKPVLHHLAHLVVHGVLHLGGYDHQTDADALEMEALEVRILASLGIADPYAGTPERVA